MAVCTYCGERVGPNATVCPHCGETDPVEDTFTTPVEAKKESEPLDLAMRVLGIVGAFVGAVAGAYFGATNWGVSAALILALAGGAGGGFAGAALPYFLLEAASWVIVGGGILAVLFVIVMLFQFIVFAFS